MDRLFKSVLSIRELKFHVDDDHVDRLSRQYSRVHSSVKKESSAARSYEESRDSGVDDVPRV